MPAPERTVRAVPLVLTVPVAAFAVETPSTIAIALAPIVRPLRLIQATSDPFLAGGSEPDGR
ncbi:hypothetical protein GCM10029978_025200 [Actinoallomurus acanthiterrae]